MGLIKCDNCGKLVSDKAQKCPECNSTIKKRKLKSSNVLKKTLLISILLITLILLIGSLYYFVLSVPSLEHIKDSVVKIEAYDDNDNLIATGSGFCAFKSNYIVTNFHVIEGAFSLKIINDGKESYDVDNILIFDYENDLAILETDVNLKPVKINNGKIKTGQKVIAIGSPLGELNTVSDGIVSNAENDKGIQISAAISHGSSGGGLFNKRHELIGVTYAGYDDAQNLNYAISTDYLNKLYRAYKNKEYHQITYSNSIDCINSDDGFEGCEDVQEDYYSVSSLGVLFSISNVKAIYEHSLSKNFKALYDEYNDDDKALVIATYQQLLDYDICPLYSCDIKSNIKKWDTNEFFINLDILDIKELAFVLVDISNYNSKNSQFNRVNNDYPLDAAQKSFILYLLGKYEWYDIHRDNKEDIFDFLDKKISNTENLGSILELLGYDVKYNKDGTLTAYWD